jgi:alkylation response protein AidB-like acyl-CoA dehydrogenase
MTVRGRPSWAVCRVRREKEMQLDFTDHDLEFRDEVRRFITEHYPAEVRERQQRGLELRKRDYLAWHQAVARRGWSVPAWPVEYGGTGWTPTQRYLWNEELALADTVPIISFGTGLVGPVIYTFGTAGQKARFLPDIVAGTVWWCQGYSEPGAGSDLASLQTRAVREGDHYVVNGQKTWTTLGHFADWGFFLVRTDPRARKQAGISFLLIDMRSPGVTVRPIITLDGTHEVNEVWLENVRVPVENRIHEENQGWTCAKALLAHERSGIAMVSRSKVALTRLRELAASVVERGRPLLEDPAFRRKLTGIEVDLLALEYTELRMLAAETAGNVPGVEVSMLKIRGTELQQRLNELALEAVGPHAALRVRATLATGAEPIAMPAAGDVADTYFNMRKTSIFGGSNEIQRNILAKAVLGL